MSFLLHGVNPGTVNVYNWLNSLETILNSSHGEIWFPIFQKATILQENSTSNQFYYFPEEVMLVLQNAWVDIKKTITILVLAIFADLHFSQKISAPVKHR